MGVLTRSEMEAAIAAGGSVLYQGRTIWQASQLPSVADLAVGDPAQETIAANAIQQQIADLQTQLDKLSSAPTAPAASDSLDAPTLDKLAQAGYATPEALTAASDEQLLAVSGIGQATLAKIRASYPKG